MPAQAWYVYQPDQPLKKYHAQVLAKNEAIDLAILQVDLESSSALVAGDPKRMPQYLDAITLVGYPTHAPGREISIKRGEVVSFATKSGIRRFNISCAIVVGNSGGPVLDKFHRVIGVAVTGADREDEAHRTEDHGVIPIQALSHLQQDEK